KIGIQLQILRNITNPRKRSSVPIIIIGYKNNRKDAESSFYYFRTFDHKEIDLVILSEGRLTLLECKDGEEYGKKDIAGFALLQNSHFAQGKNAIICTTSSIYPVGENAYALPISSI
ncbi:MAG: hypothetical protein J6A47_09495, partial [Bacilli bacterium]|nr:hypothetical protein [Bacilli bacterium]